MEAWGKRQRDRCANYEKTGRQQTNRKDHRGGVTGILTASEMKYLTKSHNVCGRAGIGTIAGTPESRIFLIVTKEKGWYRKKKGLGKG